MAKKIEEKVEKKLNSQDILGGYLKDHAGDHYNAEEDIKYKVSSGSLLMDLQTGGGVRSGCIRTIGINSGGKTSFTLNLMKNFFASGVNRRGLFYRSEGRLSEEIKERSGIKFVQKTEDWVDGTCLVVDSNVYEFVFGSIKTLIQNNAEKTLFFFVIDSADTLCKREDLEKPFEDSDQVAGGALLTSTFFKKVGLALAKRGHIITFVGQKRDSIRIDPRQKMPSRQGNASGGNSVQHQADWVFEFLPRTEFDGDLIRESPNDKHSKIIGHWCKIRIVKSTNEKNETIVRYPIRYGRTNGNSVWVEYEIVELLLGFEFIKKAGSWLTFTSQILEELKSQGFDDVPEKIQGVDSLRNLLEQKKELNDYLYKKFYHSIVV